MNQDEITDKVRKLLRLGKSTNEHEARRAIEHALRLAEKHKIDVATLALDSEIEKIIHERFPCGQRLSYVAQRALNICTGWFNVSIVVSKPNAVFIGTASDVAIAHYVFEFVTGACNRCLRAYEKSCRRKPTLNKRRNYIAGWFYGLIGHLEGNKPALTLDVARLAMVLGEQTGRREDYKKRLFPATKPVNSLKYRRTVSALTSGWLDGKKTVISTPLDGSQPILRLT